MEKKDGFSVKEIEMFTRRHRWEVFFSLLFILSSFFSFMMWGLGFSVTLLGIGGILGSCFSYRVENYARRGFHYINGQERTIQMIFAVVSIVLSVVLAPLFFLFFGLVAGAALHTLAFPGRDKRD